MQPSFQINVHTHNTKTVLELLHEKSGISKIKIKDAMNKGAVWQKATGPRKRIRRAKKIFPKKCIIEFYYDANLLDKTPPEGECIHNEKNYSVWFKPSGLMTQGTLYGDHCSILRQAEIHFASKNPLFPVNRLDRETSGILMIAHSKNSAAKLSALFQNRQVQKKYLAVVKGAPEGMDELHEISLPLDGKEAITKYETLIYNEKKNETTLNVWIETGRKHQIRRHFEMIGHPLIGDPLYGEGNKNKKGGLKLLARQLSFKCPFSNKIKSFEVSSSLLGEKFPG